MTYRVVFSPEAEDQLTQLYRDIADDRSPAIAARYTAAIVTHCEGLNTFPHRGTSRDDVRPGLRITHYRKRAVIAYSVIGDAVAIIGVFYGGQNYDAILRPEEDA